MSKDIMGFNACSHSVNKVKYEPINCPLCKGKGFYYDICYDQKGQIVTCENEIKLQQEVVKIINDIRGGNIFHQNYGCDIHNIGFGRKANETTTQRIQVMIYDSLQYLRNIQINNKIIFSNATDSELLDEIEEINVNRIDRTTYRISIKFKSAEGIIYNQTITF